MIKNCYINFFRYLALLKLVWGHCVRYTIFFDSVCQLADIGLLLLNKEVIRKLNVDMFLRISYVG